MKRPRPVLGCRAIEKSYSLSCFADERFKTLDLIEAYSRLSWFHTEQPWRRNRSVYIFTRDLHVNEPLSLRQVPCTLNKTALLRLCLTQVDRWRHSVSDVVEYVITEKVTRIYFQHSSCVHTPVGNSNTLGLYWLITYYFEAFFLKERMNISDSLYKLRISHRMSFSHYKQNTSLSQI
jgi:hypothetical protein